MFQSQYIEKLLNVFNVSMFFNFSQFFDIFGQKRRLNFNFRTNFILLIKNRKPNMWLNICLLWTIFCYLKMLTIFEKVATLQHWNQHKILKTLNWIQCWNFEKNIDITLSFNVHFFKSKTLNRNQCQCRCRPLLCTHLHTHP